MSRVHEHQLTPSEWAASGESADATLQNLDQAVPDVSGARHYVRGITVKASDGSAVGYKLESPAGTVLVQGYTPEQLDFGHSGLETPINAVVRLAVEAGGAGVITRASVWGYPLGRKS